MQVAKVYISIYGDERGQEKALEALKNKAGYVRKGLAQRMNLKNTPEVRFIKDESLERGSRVRNFTQIAILYMIFHAAGPWRSELQSRCPTLPSVSFGDA